MSRSIPRTVITPSPLIIHLWRRIDDSQEDDLYFFGPGRPCSPRPRRGLTPPPPDRSAGSSWTRSLWPTASHDPILPGPVGEERTTVTAADVEVLALDLDVPADGSREGETQCPGRRGTEQRRPYHKATLLNIRSGRWEIRDGRAIRSDLTTGSGRPDVQAYEVLEAMGAEIASLIERNEMHGHPAEEMSAAEWAGRLDELKWMAEELAMRIDESGGAGERDDPARAAADTISGTGPGPAVERENTTPDPTATC